MRNPAAYAARLAGTWDAHYGQAGRTSVGGGGGAGLAAGTGVTWLPHDDGQQHGGSQQRRFSNQWLQPPLASSSAATAVRNTVLPCIAEFSLPRLWPTLRQRIGEASDTG